MPLTKDGDFIHNSGGIVEDPRLRKRTASALVRSRQSGSALKAIRSSINEASDYQLQKSQVDIRDLKGRGKKTSIKAQEKNFPLAS